MVMEIYMFLFSFTLMLEVSSPSFYMQFSVINLYFKVIGESFRWLKLLYNQ